MGERLFSPKSLERVARAVEWEDVVIVYKDGTTNQQRYMQTIAELYERWFRGWSFPDFADALQNVAAGNFLDAFLQVVQGLPARISQLKGFYQGLWTGANPHRGRAFIWPPMPAPSSFTKLEVALIAIDSLLTELRLIVAEEEEEGEG